MEQKFFVSCLLIKEEKVLMLKKEKGRHIGQWLFPGGKIEAHENALDTVKREISKDTGLTLNEVSLRGITHFMMQELPEDPVLSKTTLYVFFSENFTGEVKESNKGTLEWVPIEGIGNRKMGRNDELFLPPMFEKNRLTFANFYHNKKKERIRYQIETL